MRTQYLDYPMRMVAEQEQVPALSAEALAYAEYQRAADTLVDIDNRVAELSDELVALIQARTEAEVVCSAFCVANGVEGDTIGNRRLFLRREMAVKVLNEKAAVALCKRLDVPGGIQYAVSPSNAAKLAATHPEMVDASLNAAAFREYVRKANLPGARERILAPWKGAVEVNEYTLVRSKPIQGDNDGQ